MAIVSPTDKRRGLRSSTNKTASREQSDCAHAWTACVALDFQTCLRCGKARRPLLADLESATPREGVEFPSRLGGLERH